MVKEGQESANPLKIMTVTLARNIFKSSSISLFLGPLFPILGTDPFANTQED